MALDTKVPLVSYRNIFDGYRHRASGVVDSLESYFNFDLSPTSSTFKDFWSPLLDTSNLKYISTASSFDTIETLSQELNNTLEARYMDYMGMMLSLDEYICFAVDAFSRIGDSIWAYGDGQIYTTKTGKLLEDGSYEIVRKGLQYYKTNIINIFTEMEDYILHDPGPTANATVYGMSRVKVKDAVYLEWKRENYFIPKMKEISDLLEDAQLEIAKLITYLNTIKSALYVWYVESFKLVSYTNLAFNLTKKAEAVANKIITFERGVTTTSIIAVNQSKYWKKQVLPDNSNRYQCLIEAINAGLASLTYPSMLESFINDSWELMVPKYGL